jgi:hypothetical protein
MTIYTDTLKEAIASAKVYLRCLEEHLEQAEAGESTDDDDIPCPQCNAEEHREYYADNASVGQRKDE